MFLCVVIIGSIPPEKKFTYRSICPIAHPGVCVGRDAELMPTIVASTDALRAILSKKGRNTAHVLFTIVDGTPAYHYHFKLAHFRGSGPRVSLLVAAKLHGNWLLDTDWNSDADFGYKVDYTVVGKFFQELGIGSTLFYAALELDREVCIPRGSLDLVKVAHYKEVAIALTGPHEQLHPPLGRVKKPRMSEGLRIIEAGMVSALDKPRRRAGVKVAMPKLKIPGKKEDALNSGSSGSSLFDSDSGASSVSEQDSDDEEMEKAAKIPRLPNDTFDYGSGLILLNRAGKSIDVHCKICVSFPFVMVCLL